MSYINPIFTELESPQAYSRFNYPDDYKEDISITKFERDTFVKGSRGSSYKSHVSQFKFKNVWPSNMTSMRVAYGDSNVLRCTIQFAYDRFFTSFTQGTKSKEQNRAVLNSVDDIINTNNTMDIINRQKKIDSERGSGTYFGFSENS